MIPLPMKRPTQQDLIDLRELIKTGKIKPVIDLCHPLNKVPNALGYIAKGHARGKIIITIG